MIDLFEKDGKYYYANFGRWSVRIEPMQTRYHAMWWPKGNSSSYKSMFFNTPERAMEYVISHLHRDLLLRSNNAIYIKSDRCCAKL